MGLSIMVGIFITLFGVASSLRCYEGDTKNDRKPKTAANCSHPFCSKIRYSNSKTKMLNTYDCDYTGICETSGCEEDRFGTVVCCCNIDLCNKSLTIPSLFATLFAFLAIV
ncbi:unnamed protein product [Cylicocyclus nassatus]|uniref:Uncharacterized protein n=1 Tax=Cylicocyclus nassatus TaxID=53992 RepID=A0AA36GTS8_CYLNA|nr:unnamed protein product [Cylicocyclus nassatus]